MKIGLIYQRNCLEEQRREVIFVDSEKEIYDYVRDKGYYSFEYCIIDNGIEQILNEVMNEIDLESMNGSCFLSKDKKIRYYVLQGKIQMYENEEGFKYLGEHKGDLNELYNMG